MNFRHDDLPRGAALMENSVHPSPPKVLVVDDAKDIRDCISSFLRASGYRVLQAKDGLEAQLVLTNERLALVISDLQMPVSDGWDVLAFCHAKHPATPVLIISGAVLGERPDIECWAAGFLPKPFDVDRFRAELQRLAPLAA